MGPNGTLMHRNGSDFIANIHINLVSIAFLNQSNSLSQNYNVINQKRVASLSEEIERRKFDWKTAAINHFDESSFQLEKLARKALNIHNKMHAQAADRKE
mmetsp:Transcript_12415/g.19427  ORF Transcript_12415/g.19427 Transcript_12415/m.19427 type:complete len:100 (+) Transcript_12415:2273-2572(+)